MMALLMRTKISLQPHHTTDLCSACDKLQSWDTFHIHFCWAIYCPFYPCASDSTHTCSELCICLYWISFCWVLPIFPSVFWSPSCPSKFSAIWNYGKDSLYALIQYLNPYQISSSHQKSLIVGRMPGPEQKPAALHSKHPSSFMRNHWKVSLNRALF